jgi:hypothetical protein
VHDFVRLQNGFERDSVYYIASAFQATASFVGKGVIYQQLGYRSEVEVQKRGHPFVELRRMIVRSKTITEVDKSFEATYRPVDWLLDENLKLQPANLSKDPVLHLWRAPDEYFL